MSDERQHEASDFALLVDWHSGNRQAGDELARRHYGRVLRFFELKAAFVAEDLTQRTFLACIQGVAKFRGDGSFKAYLFGIARRQYCEYRRRVALEEKRDRSPLDDPEFRTSLSQLFARTEQQQLLVRALAALPADALHMIQLHYWEKMRPIDIATVMDMPASSVSSRLARARAQLRRQIEQMSTPSDVRDEAVRDVEEIVRSLAESSEQTPAGVEHDGRRSDP